MGRVVMFVQPANSCPGSEFFESISPKTRNKLYGQIYAVGSLGASYGQCERFGPVKKTSAPLWEFREQGARLYCLRQLTPSEYVTIILFNGWIKRKSQIFEEHTEIRRAEKIFEEFIEEYEGGNIYE